MLNATRISDLIKGSIYGMEAASGNQVIPSYHKGA